MTEGTLELDRATLHRIARGKTQVARAIDSPEECIRLYFALMIVGCEQDVATVTIVEEGRAMLAGFIGEPLAALIFRDLEATLPKLTHRPLDTIVEGVPGVVRLERDAHAHGEAERLARAMWWGTNEDLAAPRRVRGSAILRGLLARAPTRSAVRGILLALRAAYYDLRIERALSRTRIAAWLRDALCVTAVVSVAPQLGDA